MDAILARIPDGGRYYLTVDLDGMDPSIAPAVNAPCPGGVTFEQARKLIHGLVRKGRVVGMDVVEITPKVDLNQITCITAGRLDRQPDRKGSAGRPFRTVTRYAGPRHRRGLLESLLQPVRCSPDLLTKGRKISQPLLRSALST